MVNKVEGDRREHWLSVSAALVCLPIIHVIQDGYNQATDQI